MDSFITKSELRGYYRQKRNALGDEALKLLNLKLVERFKAISFQNYRFIHFFLPIIKYNEPDTYLMIHWLRLAHPEIEIVVSRSNFDTHLMECFLWEGTENLQTNKWGIDEPTIGKKVLPQQLDAVIVPLLAFDLEGNRVGYGKGFYDRFLASCRADCRKIGLSFFDPVKKVKEVADYDVKLDCCITPDRYWQF